MRFKTDAMSIAFIKMHPKNAMNKMKANISKKVLPQTAYNYS